MSILERLAPSGRFLFAAACVAFGVQDLICLKPTFGMEPLPAWLPATLLWVVLSALVLIGGGTCTLLRRWAGPAAAVLGGLLTVWFLLLQLPGVAASPTDGSLWSCVFETLAIGSAAWMLAVVLFIASGDANGWRHPRAALAVRLCRIGYGISLPVFGVLHFIYWQYIVSVLPAWLPWPLFWTYFTAAAFFAAGAAISSGIYARLAAGWTGVMFLSWVLMLHGPRVAMNAGSRAEWTSLFVALAMGGGAWIVADALRRDTSPATTADQPSRPLWKRSL